MGMIKTIIIIALLIFGIWYFSPGLFDNLKDKATDAINVDNENTKIVHKTIDEIMTSEDNVSDEENVTIVYACDLPYYGLPDYDGTNKEGDDCMDVPVDQDYECLANPPTNYDGYIDLVDKTSSPDMVCCYTDGYCRWGDE